MEKVKILWSGLTGKTGLEALKQQANVGGVTIAAGVSRCKMDQIVAIGEVDLSQDIRWYRYQDIDFPYRFFEDVDVVVDFSHPSNLKTILTLAVMTGRPLILGTSGLAYIQEIWLEDAAKRIPIFRGGNFRFKVKNFINEAVKMADGAPGKFVLVEHFYRGKELPSETSKVVQRRVAEVTDKEVEVRSYDDLDCQDLPCSWEFQVHSRTLPDVIYSQTCCRTIGFDELAHDVLEIAKVMAHKPVRPGKFYDLDEIWDELPH